MQKKSSMLNRRLLRIKIFQALYSYYQSNNDSFQISENNLLTSLNKMHELFVLNLSLLIKLSDVIEDRYEEMKKKFIKKENEENLKRLSQNLSIINLSKNESLKKYLNSYKVNWGGQEDLLTKIARSIEDSKEYKEFRSAENNENDNLYLKSIYKKYIYTSSLLLSYFEELNIHWVQDQYYVGIIILSYFKKESFFVSSEIPIPNVFKENVFDEEESDETFVKKLYSKTIINADEYDSVINKHLQNWEPDRIALSDIIIMRMACAEVLNFPQIPINSSLNEYIEIAKSFSTPKSKIFINGILDKVISYYNREGKVEKIGRGLQENS